MGVDLSTGFIFRKVGDGNVVLETPITYDVAYDRLRSYLGTLGIYQGETPHSLRGGCAVTMRVAGVADGVQDLQQHIGWRSSAMPMRYSRAGRDTNMDISRKLQKAIDGVSKVPARDVELQFLEGSYDSLPLAS